MISAVVNFSSSEAAFLGPCIRELSHFASQIIVPVCDHFFDGTGEDEDLLHLLFLSNPNASFIYYPFSSENFYAKHPAYCWHNLSRIVGKHFVSKDVEYILFLDADEIVEGERFLQWKKNFPLQNYSALLLACYWYFREAKYRSIEVEDSPLLIRKDALFYDAMMRPDERVGMYRLAKGEKVRMVEKESPLFHHYSWVRSKEQLLRKVRSWSHRGERDWERLIEEEFSKPFSGRDFVHGYSFEEVEPRFDFEPSKDADKSKKNVTFLTTRDIHKIDLQLKLGEVFRHK